MRYTGWGWYALCAIVCVCAQSTGARSADEFDDSKGYDLEDTDKDFSFKDASADKLSRELKTDFDEFAGELIPMKSPKPGKKGFSPLSLNMEPDAEMLPAHYTGVKPPGVDHMELRRDEPDALGSNSEATILTRPQKFVQAGGAAHISSKQAAQAAKGEEGRKKVVSYESGNKGHQEREKKKVEYSEVAGKKKSHSENESNAKGVSGKVEAEKGAAYEVEGSHEKGKNVAGFHNVYHKDEFKKDADFYDNDHEGGKFKKHSRYNEKHTAAEGSYKKGGSADSGFHEAELSKEGVSEKARANKEAEGRDAKQGYDGFFKNFQGFAKEGSSAHGRKFGFADGKAR